MNGIKHYLKKNYIFYFGLIFGIILSSISVYATNIINSKDVLYSNSKSGLTSSDVQSAIDELYTKVNDLKNPDVGEKSIFKVGYYVKMEPTNTSYTISAVRTGYDTNQIINPSELNLWRVIRINDDQTVDMVSEYVSSTNVYFRGKTGYLNYVGILNQIAKQYENANYTVGSRHIGYDGSQTEYITDTSVLTATTVPQINNTSETNVTSATEAKGLGDMGYETDYNLVKAACKTLIANKAGTTTKTPYWAASRNYSYVPVTGMWYFYGRSINESMNTNCFYYYDGGHFYADDYSWAVRPIVTLKSGLTPSSGDGSSSSPYVLP